MPKKEHSEEEGSLQCTSEEKFPLARCQFLNKYRSCAAAFHAISIACQFPFLLFPEYLANTYLHLCICLSSSTVVYRAWEGNKCKYKAHNICFLLMHLQTGTALPHFEDARSSHCFCWKQRDIPVPPSFHLTLDFRAFINMLLCGYRIAYSLYSLCSLCSCLSLSLYSLCL